MRMIKEQSVVHKVLEDDEGCEQVSRSYHIAANINNKSASKSPKGASRNRMALQAVTSFGNIH
jgi:hypothetical protein